MNPAQLFSHFDQISDAPDAIRRLRRFILDLAVRGKLIEQDPKDEPASELLKRIQMEKARLVSAGAIKKEKSLPAIEEDEIPFELPIGWAWERLGNIGDTNIGLTYSPQDLSDVGIPVLRSSNIQNGKLDFSDLVRVKCEPKQSVMVQDGDLLICARNGSRGLVGKVAVIEDLKEPAAFGAFMAILRSGVNQYLYHFICSPLFRQVIDEVNTTTINQITQNNLRSTLAPIPPLAEQHRIVAKVSELMALCDRLEAAQAERESRRDRLVASSLNRLDNGEDPEAFQEHARFYFNHLPRLTTKREHIQQLRQTILNLAVRGELVPQDSNDEPASELLRRIQAEKMRLVKEGKIKKDKPLPEISQAEKLFVLPDGWEWVRMQAAFDVRDGTHDTPRYIERDGVPLITSRNFVDGKISFDEAKLISWSDHASIKKRSVVDRGDILYSMIGGNIGNQVLVDTDREFSIKNVALFKYYTRNESLPEYLNLFLKTVTIGLQNEAAGGAQPFVSLALLRNIPMPIPPLAEQHRIVAKVDELMALCDRFAAQLATTQTDSRRLLEAVLHQALAT